MLLTDHDLLQIDDLYIKSLEHEKLQEVALRLVKDLKEARERLNQTPDNSSRPPSTMEPWFNDSSEDKEEKQDDKEKPVDIDELDLLSNKKESDDLADNDKPDEKPEKRPSGSKGGRPGKPKGAPGFGRTQKLPVTGEVIHKGTECAACGNKLDEDSEFIARTGHYTIDIEIDNEDKPGIKVTNTKHIYGDTVCSCGHVTHTKPNRCEKESYSNPCDEEESDWKVEITEWHLVGPLFMSMICFLAMRMKMSRPRIQEFLIVWLGVHLSVGTINQCIHESGRAVAPLEDNLIEEIVKSELLNIDETSWKEKAKLKWLWVFVTATTVLYVIGARTKEVLETILNKEFSGYVMTDGYRIYRQYLKRLRCWAHLKRKAIGISESLDKDAQIFGQEVLEVLKILMDAVYQARAGPMEDLRKKYEKILDELKEFCEKYKNSEHEKTRALAREFLNDWEAIFLVLSHPELPLTNNEAEQALRHWVILRKLCYGTRTPQGSRVFGLLASVIDTCRRRKVSPWKFLAKVISERRKGNLCPPIPTAV
jgi:transposase